MPTFAYAGRTRAGQTVTGRAHRGHDGRGGGRRSGASRSWSPGSTRSKAQGRGQAEGGQEGRRSVPAKNLAIFTRQFSVMIDAGLPLVQCLDILGKQEPHKGFSGVILKIARGRRGGRRAGRRDEEASEDLRRALLEHDRRRRGGRYPRHHPQAPRHLHREVGQAEGRGQVRDDLPDRGHRHRGARRRRDPVEGHPDVRAAVRRPRRPAAAADARRHRRQQRHRGLRLDCHRRHRRCVGYGLEDLLRDRQRPARRSTGSC